VALPDPNPSLWNATTPATDYGPLRGDEVTDVVVVGGGISGLTTALLLAQRGLSVAVVEGGRIAGGSTGYTTAKVSSLHSLIYAELIDRIGAEKARIYGAANQAAIEQIAELAESHRIDCGFTRAPAYTYTVDPARHADIEAEAAAAGSLGLPASPTTDTDLPYPVEAAVRFDNQAHFHPRHYALGLAAALEQSGARVFEESRAVDIDEDDSGVVVRVEGGTIRGRDAVVATLLPFLDIGGFFAKSAPTRSYAISVRCRGPVPTGMYLSVDSPTRSIRPVDLDGGGDGLIVGGNSHKPGEAESTEACYQELEAWARQSFAVEGVVHRWSAQDYVTADRVPYIGRCPRADHVFVATGFGKWGMTGGTAAAMILADLLTGKDNPWSETFDSTRIGNVHAAKSFVKMNASVGMHFVKDRIARLRPADVESLAPGQGGIVKVGGHTVGAYRSPSGNLHAVSISCTHLGCTLKWNDAETSWDCPCHGSRFTSTGAIIEGPATRPLDCIDVDG
jgi:glycine/D-amino acid oxidase-like deaminating enzyme/nitrite reductase/ring-hydroxylating ferredoxin subunit